MKRAVLIAGLLTGLPAAAHAQTAPAPHVTQGDTWTYVDTSDVDGRWNQVNRSYTVTHATAATIGVAVKAVGSTATATEQPMAADWSRMRNVNGHDTVVNRPLVFPLSPGKNWGVDYTEDHPNPQHDREHFHTPY